MNDTATTLPDITDLGPFAVHVGPVRRVGWRASQYAEALGVSRPMIWKYMDMFPDKLKSVKIDGVRIILTPPEEFLASLAERKNR